MRLRGLAETMVGFLVMLSGCGSETVLSTGAEPSRSVSQGGAQDVGEFRRILAQGEVPQQSLLDEVGFFAEHAYDLPPSDCNGSVCAHAMLAVAPRFDEGTWTMAFVALGSSLAPEELPRKARHLIVVSEPWRGTAVSGGDFSALLRKLGAALGPDDVVSVISAGGSPRRLAVRLRRDALERLSATPEEEIQVSDGSPPAPVERDPYGALAGALDIVTAEREAGFAHHVLLLTAGLNTRNWQTLGIQSLADFSALATRFAGAGVPISLIGLANARYERDVPTVLAELTNGNYYFVNNSTDLLDAVAVEAETAFVPLAKNLKIELSAAPGYRIGQVFGARRAVVSDERAILESPVLYLGARTRSSDVQSGRRGGGGGFFVQLLSDGEGAAGPAPAFDLVVSYDDAQTGARYEQRTMLETPLGVGRRPAPDAPFFSDSARAKPFMALNMYLALRAAVRLYEGQGCGAAQGVRSMMAQSYDYWRATYADADIAADFQLLTQLTSNIAARCDQSLYEVPEAELACFIT